MLFPDHRCAPWRVGLQQLDELPHHAVETGEERILRVAQPAFARWRLEVDAHRNVARDGMQQLYDLGVVDVLAMDGDGEAAVYNYVRKHSRSGNGRRAIEQVRQEIAPVSRDELVRVVGVWADAALRISDRDLRMMERLVRAQSRSLDAEELPGTPVATVMSLPRAAS